MALVLTHFWLLVLAVMLANIALGRVRMRPLVAEGVLTAGEADRFCVRAAIAFAVSCAAFEVASVLSGVSVDCQLVLPLADRRLWPFYALTLLSGALLLYWVWRRGGDETLAKVGPAFFRWAGRGARYTPGQVRVASVALLVISWGGHVAFRSTSTRPAPAAFARCSEETARGGPH